MPIYRLWIGYQVRVVTARTKGNQPMKTLLIAALMLSACQCNGQANDMMPSNASGYIEKWAIDAGGDNAQEFDELSVSNPDTDLLAPTDVGLIDHVAVIIYGSGSLVDNGGVTPEWSGRVSVQLSADGVNWYEMWGTTKPDETQFDMPRGYHVVNGILTSDRYMRIHVQRLTKGRVCAVAILYYDKSIDGHVTQSGIPADAYPGQSVGALPPSTASNLHAYPVYTSTIAPPLTIDIPNMTLDVTGKLETVPDTRLVDLENRVTVIEQKNAELDQVILDMKADASFDDEIISDMNGQIQKLQKEVDQCVKRGNQ
jgi:hypothetical protein